jgi:hypothetical protein
MTVGHCLCKIHYLAGKVREAPVEGCPSCYHGLYDFLSGLYIALQTLLLLLFCSVYCGVSTNQVRYVYAGVPWLPRIFEQS